MTNNNYQIGAILMVASVMSLLCCNVLAQSQLLDEDEDVYGSPWPTYSLQNMPKTQFTCRDKILGGYYADPETQCQMFHVCVKLPGVGVQDYRFLCPNSTAFDQELQICANWADVDCDKATSYYDNNNLNDLYRGNDDIKNTNDEDGTFHLQRAESGDVRRSKENNRGDQKSRPRHNYGQTTAFGSSSSSNSNLNSNLNADNTQPSKRPITSYYTPTSTTTTITTTPTTTSTTTTTTERSYYNNHNNYNDDSKQDIDDIFKGSHSSHFFANRHGGREYDEEPAVVARSRPNDFNDNNRKTTEVSSGKSRVTPTRGQRISSQAPPATGTTPTTTTSTATTTTTVAPKRITLHASYNVEQHYKSSTPSTLAPTAGTTPRQLLASGITSRFSFSSVNDYQTQERIQPTTYNPNNAYRFKTTEFPASSTKLTGKNAQDFDKETTHRHKPTLAARKQKLGPQESNYINHNEFAEVAKPQPFQVTHGTPRKSTQLEPQYQRSRATGGQQLERLGNQEPAPFKASASAPSNKPRTFTSRGSITYKATTQRYADDEFHYPTTTSTFSPKKVSTSRDTFTPTTFKPTTYKKAYEQSYYQTQQTLRPNQSQKHSSKQTSSVAPAVHTTANPNYKVDEDDGQYHPELYENDFPRNRLKFLRSRSSSSTTTTSTTSAPMASRQPQGFSHNFQQAHSHLKSQQQAVHQKKREQDQDQDQDQDDEDELFKTAQSLNFGAASINKLRADIYKAEKTSQQYNSQYSPQAAPSSPKTTTQTTSRPTTHLTSTTSTTRRPTTTSTTTVSSGLGLKKSSKSKKEQQHENKKSKSLNKRPPHADEDTSYDYAYYDTD